MSLHTLRVNRKTTRYTRDFQAALLGVACADAMWEIGEAKNMRPVYLAFAGTDQQVKVMVANLRSGQRAIAVNNYGHDQRGIDLEFMKTAGHKWRVDRYPGGTAVATCYLPELFDLEVGPLVPQRVRFVFAPPTWWAQEQEDALAAHGVDREAAVASMFAAFIDRRTVLPVLNDRRFHLRLWRAAQDRPWFSRSSGEPWNKGALWAYPAAVPTGLEDFALVDMEHATCEEFLREETRSFFIDERPNYDEESEHGQARIAGGGGVLPNPAAPASQYQLFS